ncbi:hypothetical protein M758_12G070300 [Ceratodon purpureus]|nr:hypothetical protein M758_12G070300 [Ceratodon purpureus]
MFRRSPLSNSTVLAQILASDPSDRLITYQEAGYRHSHTDHAVVVKLDNALKDLQTHVQQARAVVEEIQRLLEEANGMMHADSNTRLGNITLTEGAGGSQIAQTTDAGQAVDFTQRSDIGHRAGGHEQSSSQILCFAGHQACILGFYGSASTPKTARDIQSSLGIWLYSSV